MTAFDLLFLLCALAAIATLTTALILAFIGQWRRGVRLGMRVAACAVVYGATVVIVALASPRTVFHVGDTQCFDDWCIAVDSVQSHAAGSATAYAVTLRVSSRAQRVTQRERGAVVYLTDARHRRFDPVPDASAVPLDVALGPGASATTVRSFIVPVDAHDVGLVFAHDGWFPIGDFIITQNPWFHGVPIVRF